ncbi:class I SAM-dependent methyltransferase [Oceanisphaera arctica]|uniref:SAM-dependent methyltransferase n=1 Tax=Oceanisphaera arctica TaxID=641510 RepID=A0A2P5TJR0_9GAMM|nr:class I SAM-dependent methyltransferase [Oceanisphaera arctica]PPL15236.1 SAM-dependent methyltransferase [Oceanisphaera arctica]GHA28069.1 SAM-dependent methyltransferase [Oceanisphaera arctica]
MSLDYYQQQADGFFRNTITVDMTPLYDRFLPRVPAGGHIVDAGCGSGRDSLHFFRLGYQVTAFDASPALVQLARTHSGLPVALCRFEDFSTPAPADAIWACASLLHVPLTELAAVMAHLTAQLKPGGVFYCSFKYGQGETCREGRHFTNLDENGLKQLLRGLPLHIAEQWQTGDLRPDREQERWLNALLIKVPA